jgi:hypothetical protein
MLQRAREKEIYEGGKSSDSQRERLQSGSAAAWWWFRLIDEGDEILTLFSLVLSVCSVVVIVFD